MMKNILIVSDCVKRRNTIGLVKAILLDFENLDRSKFKISLFDTNFFELDHNPADYKVDQYYGLSFGWIDNIIKKIPKIRAIYAQRKAVGTFKELLKKEYYYAVVFSQVPIYAGDMVSFARKYGTKTYFLPYGSDILQVSEKNERKLGKAFEIVDGVIGRTKSNVLTAAKEVYHVPKNKIFENREILGSIIALKNRRGKLTRVEMHNEVGIPYSAYNIVCGYSGRQTHRHSLIIDALICVKDLLPKGYQIVFPMTYGAADHHEIIIEYAARLKKICDEAGLNTVFMTDFKTYGQMAYLHLITDLFIEIQPTDNGNAFMIEALYAQNQIITGRWLNYERFEQFGEPYYLIDKPEDLAQKLRDYFTGSIEKINVPQSLVDYFDVPDGYDRSTFWELLFDERLNKN